MGDRFDSEAFYAALNAVRLSRQRTWKEVAQEAGINASTLSRIGQGTNPDVDGLAALLRWSNLKAESLFRALTARGPNFSQRSRRCSEPTQSLRKGCELNRRDVISAYDGSRRG